MSLQAEPRSCPNCASTHIVKESGYRHLCLYCHSLLESDSRGEYALVGHQCAHCGDANAAGAQTCRGCGRSLRTQCRKCKLQMAVWQETCQHCGTNQAAYEQQLQLEAKRRAERERQATSARRRYRPRRRRYRGMGFWRVGWMFWLFFWGRYLLVAFRESTQWLEDNGGGLVELVIGNQVPDLVFTLVAGICIFGVGTFIFLMAALPLYAARRQRP